VLRVVVGEVEVVAFDACGWWSEVVLVRAKLEEVCVAGEGDVVGVAGAGDEVGLSGVQHAGDVAEVAADVDFGFCLIDGDVGFVEDGGGEGVLLEEVGGEFVDVGAGDRVGWKLVDLGGEGVALSFEVCVEFAFVEEVAVGHGDDCLRSSRFGGVLVRVLRLAG
jgi:hypothetical protein